MGTTKKMRSLLMAGLLAAASAHAAGDAIHVETEDGKSGAGFQIGDSNCELVDGRIRCTLGK